MNSSLDITLLQPHALRLQEMLAANGGVEAAGYLYFGISAIEADPWDGTPRLRLVSHRVEEIELADRISASELHVTWSTRGFMKVLSRAKQAGLVRHPMRGTSSFDSDVFQPFLRCQ